MTRVIFYTDDKWLDDAGDKCLIPQHNDLIDVELCDNGWEKELVKMGLRTVGVDNEYFRIVRD
jgi:hypothetical protein